MTEKSGYRGRRQTSGRLSVARNTAARRGAFATFIALSLFVTTASAMGATSLAASLTGASVGAGDGSEVLRAPLRQSTTNVADPETPTDSSSTSETSRMADIVAVVNRQGVPGAKNLQSVSTIAVPNLMPEPEFVVDARAERAAEANAAATAAAVAATEVALTVQATVEAQEAEAASKASALAAIQEAEAQAAASATAAAIATATARDGAAEVAATLSAQREAEVRAAEAAATRNANRLAAASVVSNPKMPDRMSSLLIALMPMLGGILGLRLWRSRKEPFVLKANPIGASSSAGA